MWDASICHDGLLHEISAKSTRVNFDSTSRVDDGELGEDYSVAVEK